jgi:hypothetical protein
MAVRPVGPPPCRLGSRPCRRPSRAAHGDREKAATRRRREGGRLSPGLHLIPPGPGGRCGGTVSGTRALRGPRGVRAAQQGDGPPGPEPQGGRAARPLPRGERTALAFARAEWAAAGCTPMEAGLARGAAPASPPAMPHSTTPLAGPSRGERGPPLGLGARRGLCARGPVRARAVPSSRQATLWPLQAMQSSLRRALQVKEASESGLPPPRKLPRRIENSLGGSFRGGIAPRAPRTPGGAADADAGGAGAGGAVRVVEVGYGLVGLLLADRFPGLQVAATR